MVQRQIRNPFFFWTEPNLTEEHISHRIETSYSTLHTINPMLYQQFLIIVVLLTMFVT